MLQLKNISLKFTSTSENFFTDLNCSFDAGKISFVQGKNGIGKSTLFRLIQCNFGAQEIVGGTINIDSKIYPLTNKKIISSVKMVHQKFDLMLADKFTFDLNLTFATFDTFPGLAPLGNAAHNSFDLDRFGINPQTPVARLSGGQRQILAILMVLQKPTSVLLLDEPTSALDEKNSRMVMDFLKLITEKQQLVTLIITHDAGLVKEYASDGYFEITEMDGARTIKESAV